MGRMSRFTAISIPPRRQRPPGAYLAALERASVDRDIGPFARFTAERVARAMKQAG